MSISAHYAVASKEGLAISEYFGHAKHFFVYEVSENTCRLLENREVSRYCLGIHSDKSNISDILETIKDCAAVFVARIGEGTTDTLESQGIMVVSDYAWEKIEPSLQDFFLTHRN